METALSAEFSGVRVLPDSAQTVALGARAFTRDEEIDMAPGEWAPYTRRGQELLGHELAHVLQQRSGRAPAPVQFKGTGVDQDSGLEAEADAAGARVTRPPDKAPEQASSADDLSPWELQTAIYEAFRGSLWSEDEGTALDGIRGRSVATIKKVRGYYLEQHGIKLEDDFKSYCNAEEAAEAVALIWPAMSLVERMEHYNYTLSENEDGMLQVLRDATQAERNASLEPRMWELLDLMSDVQQYAARKLLLPQSMIENVVWRIEHAEGLIDDDEEAIYMAILDLTPAQRKDLWDNSDNLLHFLNEEEKASIERMCVKADGTAATETTALAEAMTFATEGLGTEDDLVSQVVGQTGSLSTQEATMKEAIATGFLPDGRPLDAETHSKFAARLIEIGDAQTNLLTAQRGVNGELISGTFLEQLEDDVGDDQFEQFGKTMQVDPYQRAKQRILQSVGLFNDDEDAVREALRGLHGLLELPPGITAEQLSPAELRERQAEADAKLRQRLLSDPQLAGAWENLEDDQAMIDTYVSARSYEIALADLDEAFHGMDTDEEGIFRILTAMSAADRLRMSKETPPIYVKLTTSSWLTKEEKGLIAVAIETGRIPTDKAVDWGLGGWGDGTEEEMLDQTFEAMEDAERGKYRLGYWLHKETTRNRDPRDRGMLSADERAAIVAFESLQARLVNELEDEELDVALDKLLGTPSLEEIKSAEGRLVAAGIMHHRHHEKLELNGALTEALTETDETAEGAALQFDAAYYQAVQDGELSEKELLVLAGLDAEFNSYFEEYKSTVNLVSNIAGTVAAVVASIVIVVLSEGALAPAAKALIAEYGGTALWAAVSGATAKVAVSEATGGDFYGATSAEGARDALVGGAEGVMMILGAGLAARAVEFAGLGGRALASQITRVAMSSTRSALGTVGKSFARGGIEAAIDGFLGGAVGELVMTLTDAQTWKKSVWDAISNSGLAILRGGGFGAASGLVTGGVLEAASTYLRIRGIRGLDIRIDDGLATGGHIDYSFDAGLVDNVVVKLGPDISEVDLHAHIDAALALQRYSGALQKLRITLADLRGQKTEAFPIGSRAWEAEREIPKLQQMIDGKLAEFTGRNVDPETAARLLAEVQLLEANLVRFREVIDEMDISVGRGRIGRPDAPPGYPDPPEGHFYWERADGSWDIKRYPNAGVEPKQIELDASGSPTGFKPRTGAEETERFPGAASPEQVFEMLAGSDSRSSFKAYADMLKREGLANDATILDAIPVQPGGMTVDAVRHNLKKQFESRVLDRMRFDDDGIRLSALDSWKKLREMTTDLNSSDKGNLTEAWYVAHYTDGAATHVRIGTDINPNAKGDRFADIVEAGRIVEIKSGEGVLSQHDLDQFDDYIRFQNQGGKLGGQTIEDITYVLTSPSAARANLEWITDSLDNHANLSFILFNSAGVCMVFHSGNVASLAKFVRGN